MPKAPWQTLNNRRTSTPPPLPPKNFLDPRMLIIRKKENYLHPLSQCIVLHAKSMVMTLFCIINAYGCLKF